MAVRKQFLLYLIQIILAPVMVIKGQESSTGLSSRAKSLIILSAYAASGDLDNLAKAQHQGLDNGLTVNEVKEAMIHLYAYAGFPRSIRGLQTLMAVVEDRKTKGVKIVEGREATPILRTEDKYERGRQILNQLTRSTGTQPLTGYAAFAPIIDVFLKEHLFADIFERDVLSYTDREWVTISTLTALGKLEPMLRSHLAICRNLGITDLQLESFVSHIAPAIDPSKLASAKAVVAAIVGNANALNSAMDPSPTGFIFPTGQKVTNNNFTGTVYLQMLTDADSSNQTAVGNVTFLPGARTHWHYHPAGQILMVIEGEGYYQEKGSEKRILRTGDVVKCAPNKPHWHGASKDHKFVQVAITNNQRGTTVWLEPVTDTVYFAESSSTK